MPAINNHYGECPGTCRAHADQALDIYIQYHARENGKFRIVGVMVYPRRSVLLPVRPREADILQHRLPR